MGSGNSSPIKRAEVVETEAHQDAVEIRFDHLAFGGTACIAIIIALLLYWMYRRKKNNQAKSRRRRRRTRSRSRINSPRRGCCRCGQQWYPMQPFPSFPMMPMNNPWPAPTNPPPMQIYDTPRFSEIRETTPALSAPARPPPPQNRQLPSPLPRTQQEEKA